MTVSLFVKGSERIEDAIQVLIEDKVKEIRDMQKKYERMTVKKRHGIDYLFIPSGSKGRLRYIAPEYYKDLVMKNFEWVIEHWENEVKKIPDIVNMCVIKRHKGNFYVNLPPRWQSKLQYNFLLIPARILGEQRVKVVPTDEIY